MATIFVFENTDKGTLHGRFDLQRDEGGYFVIAPSELGGAKVYIPPDQIKPDGGKFFHADYFYDRPIKVPKLRDN